MIHTDLDHSLDHQCGDPLTLPFRGCVDQITGSRIARRAAIAIRARKKGPISTLRAAAQTAMARLLRMRAIGTTFQVASAAARERCPLWRATITSRRILAIHADRKCAPTNLRPADRARECRRFGRHISPQPTQRTEMTDTPHQPTDCPARRRTLEVRLDPQGWLVLTPSDLVEPAELSRHVLQPARAARAALGLT